MAFKALRQRCGAVLLGCGLSLLLLALIEGGCRLVQAVAPKATSAQNPFTQITSTKPMPTVLRYRLATNIEKKLRPQQPPLPLESPATLEIKCPSCSRREKGFSVNAAGVFRATETDVGSGRTIYDVIYQFDSYQRRVIPLKTEGRSRHFLTLGCSQTLGSGLEAEGTLAAQFAQLQNQYEPYILAQHRGEPSQVLALARHFRGLEGISQKQGMAVFRLYHYHFGRLFHSLEETGHRDRFASLEVSADGKVDVSRTFEQARPLQAWIQNVVKSSAIRQVFNIDYPSRYGDSDLAKMADVLSALRDEYHAQTSPQNPFVVILGYGPLQPMIPYLEERQIYYLDYTAYPEERLTKNFPYLDRADTHYTAEINQIFAEILAEDLSRFIKKE